MAPRPRNPQHHLLVITGLITTVAVGAILLASRRLQRLQVFAFGPILLTGALAALFLIA